MTAYFQAKELWGLIDGTETLPATPAALPAAPTPEQMRIRGEIFEKLAKYPTRVARVKTILFQMVSKSQLHLIARAALTTPRQQWEELVGTFDRPSLSNKLQLQTRLLEVQMRPGTSVDDYLKDLQDVTERLAALNAPVDPDFQVAVCRK